MEVVWYIILAILIGTYIVLDGYDLGAGIAYLLFPDTDEEKEKIINSIRSIWDANEVWLLAFMGLSYAVFPKFSSLIIHDFGGYIMLFFLFLLLKTLSFNLLVVFKDKPIRKKLLGWGFGIFDFMLVVFISLIFANILRGIFLENSHENLAFLSQKFSPFTQKVGIFDWFTLLGAASILIAILIHGTVWIILKNSGAFNRKLKKIVQGLAVIEIILIGLFLVALYILHPQMMHYYWQLPFLFIFPILSFISLAGLVGIRSYQGENKGFVLSTNMIIFSWISLIIAIFPRFIFNLGKDELTLYNAGFQDFEGFHVKWWVLAIGFVLLIYSILVHKYVKGEAPK